VKHLKEGLTAHRAILKVAQAGDPPQTSEAMCEHNRLVLRVVDEGGDELHVKVHHVKVHHVRGRGHCMHMTED
jgi:hypothetical protein